MVADYGIARFLSSDEQEHYCQLALPRRQADWLAGRIAAKTLVHDVLRSHPRGAPSYRSIGVLNTSAGTPFLQFDDQPALNERFNISIAHHDGFAVAALAETRTCGTIGVDLEWYRPLSDRLIGRVLSSAEQQRLCHVRRCFGPPNIAIWCLKEAVLKASHSAADVAMRQIDLTWDRRGRISARLPNRAAPISATWYRRGAHLFATAVSRGGSDN